MNDLASCGGKTSGAGPVAPDLSGGVVPCRGLVVKEREMSGAVDFSSNRLGYGAMRLTGAGMWGEYPDRAAGIALLRRVVDAGVTFIDTADAYGPHTNEALIRDAPHPYPAGLVIATKGGFIRGGPDYADFGAVGNREYLRQCAFLSARRLGVDQIDLYYRHTPHATDVPFEDQVGTLAELRDQGVIKRIGLSNVRTGQFRAARQITEIAAVTALYNLSERTGVGLLAAAESSGTAFSPWHPTTVTEPPGGGKRFSQALARICESHHATVRQVSIAWLLRRSPLILPIPGTSNLDHFQENLGGLSVNLTDDDVDIVTHLVPE
jgi:aryl-alcohol dehydrogenase-like predicted oxidoreductase